MTRALAAVLVLLGSPGVALACPSCARDTSPWAPVLIGTMILLPWAVGLTVYRVVKRGEAGFRP